MRNTEPTCTFEKSHHPCIDLAGDFQRTLISLCGIHPKPHRGIHYVVAQSFTDNTLFIRATTCVRPSDTVHRTHDCTMVSFICANGLCRLVRKFLGKFLDFFENTNTSQSLATKISSDICQETLINNIRSHSFSVAKLFQQTVFNFFIERCVILQGRSGNRKNNRQLPISEY